MTRSDTGAEPPPFIQTVRGLCPRCGRGSLFRGPVQFADRCEACDLGLGQFNVGDGPAAFLILVIGALLTVGALLLDAAVEPAWYVHLLWLPIGLLLTGAGLRLAKAWLLGAEYRNRAREGRLAP